MTNLVAGLLSAALSTNPPAAVSNLAQANYGLAMRFVNTNDPVDMAFHQIMEDDDAAEKDVLQWTENPDTNNTGTNAFTSLQERIRHRLAGIKGEYENFIDHHPNHPGIRLAYGSFLNDTHDEDGAVAQWDKARELDSNNPAPWNNLANYYGHRGPVKKAFEYYDKAISLDSNETVYYHNEAVTVYLFRKDAEEYYHLTEDQVFDKSLDLYRKAIALAPDDFILFSDYAESFYGTKPPRWKDGLAAWTQALQIAHDEIERQGVCIHLARINLKLGNLREARNRLNEVTDPTYVSMKRTLLKNLNAAVVEAETNSPAIRAPAKP